MAGVQPLSPSLARLFRSGRPALDLVHTGGEGKHAAHDLLREPTDLEHWLGHLLDADVRDAGPEDLERVRVLRRALFRLAYARAEGEGLDSDDVDTLNLVAAEPPLVPRLDADGGAAPLAGTAAGAIATLARDAVDLIGGPFGHRVRVCAAADCDLLFVDTSRPGSRRWCSMERCGTLSKVRAHRARG